MRLKIFRSADEVLQTGMFDEEEDAGIDLPVDATTGTATVLSLTKPWHGTQRTVVADSAFALFATAYQCAKNGLGFIGSVKTATKNFPLTPLQNTILPKKGNYVGFHSKVKNVEYLGYVWAD